MPLFGLPPFGEGAASPPPELATPALQKIASHCEQGKLLLLQQFKGKPRLEKLLCIYLDQCQEIEEALWQLLTERSIETAELAELMGLGAIVGQSGAGLDEDTFRAAIRARIRANRSSGREDELCEVLGLIAGPGAEIDYSEPDPATARLVLSTRLAAHASIVADLMQTAKSGGVRLLVETTAAEPGETFAFASSAVVETDDASGFADVDGTVGGQFANVIEA